MCQNPSKLKDTRCRTSLQTIALILRTQRSFTRLPAVERRNPPLAVLWPRPYIENSGPRYKHRKTGFRIKASNHSDSICRTILPRHRCDSQCLPTSSRLSNLVGNKVSLARKAVQRFTGKLTAASPSTVTIEAGEKTKCVLSSRIQPRAMDHNPIHSLRWVPYSPARGPARGFRCPGGVITLPASSRPPIRGRGGGGVIGTHTARPSFAITKVDFPKSFDRQPEFWAGRGSILSLVPPPPLSGGGEPQPNSAIHYGS